MCTFIHLYSLNVQGRALGDAQHVGDVNISMWALPRKLIVGLKVAAFSCLKYFDVTRILLGMARNIRLYVMMAA